MLRLTSFSLLACVIAAAQTPAPATGKLDLDVMTAERKPISGANVNWVGPDKRSHTDLTGEDGHLRLFGLAPGVYRLGKIVAAGYSGAHSNPGGSFYIPADNTAVLHATMVPNAAIGGTVTDESGMPIPDAVVVVYRLAAPNVVMREAVGTAATNSAGRYLIPDLPPGAAVSLVARAYVPLEHAVEIGRGFEPAYSASFTVRAGLTENIDVRLLAGPTFHIRGSVSAMPENEGALVFIKDCGNRAEDNSAMRTTVNKNGSFDAGGLVPGTYCLVFEVAQGTEYKPRSDNFVATIDDRDVEHVQMTAKP
jgi:Carboxypeptidase regulatory-like domain